MPFDPNDQETKDAIKAAIEEAVTGLQAKNSELLGKLKKAQKDSAIDPADHAALQAELEETQAKLAELGKAMKLVTEEADKIKKAYETEAQFSHRLLVENGLSDAIIKAGVKPEFSKAVKAMLAGQVKLESDGENRVAKIGDKTLDVFVAEWVKTDEGKHFALAAANQGGGAAGGGTGAPQTKKWSEMNLDERTNLFKSNPEQAKKLQGETA
jgi:hypothetical protein